MSFDLKYQKYVKYQKKRTRVIVWNQMLSHKNKGSISLMKGANNSKIIDNKLTHNKCITILVSTYWNLISLLERCAEHVCSFKLINMCVLVFIVTCCCSNFSKIQILEFQLQLTPNEIIPFNLIFSINFIYLFIHFS